MQKIEHEAVVIKQTEEKIFLRIKDKETCGGCPIFSFCRVAKNEAISLPRTRKESFETGEEVGLYISQKAENMGILLFYGLPSIIIFVSLVAGYAVGSEDMTCALFALGFLAIYVFLLIGLRKKIFVDFEIRRRAL